VVYSSKFLKEYEETGLKALTSFYKGLNKNIELCVAD